MITNRSAGSRLAQMDVDMDKTAQQNELPPYCKDCTAAFEAFKKTFAEAEKLYHYTSFESAIKILASQQLRYSQLKGLNDINESYRPVYLKFDGVFPEDKSFKDLENAVQQFRQISFTIDETGNHPGFAIPAMWAHYAQKGNGICLVFSKAKLEQRLKSSKYVAFQKVHYAQGYDSSLILSESNISEYQEKLFADRGNAFFIKTEDWAYEQEYRVIKRIRGTKDAFLDVENAFLAVILCNAPDIKPTDHVSGSAQYSIIQKIAGKIPICVYGVFFEERILSYENSQVWSSKHQYATDAIKNS